jgi:hypothetical protein
MHKLTCVLIAGRIGKKTCRVAQLENLGQWFKHATEFQSVIFIDNAPEEPPVFLDSARADDEISMKQFEQLMALLGAHNCHPSAGFIVVYHTRIERISHAVSSLLQHGGGMKVHSIVHYVSKRVPRAEKWKNVMHCFALITHGSHEDLQWLEYDEARNFGNVVINKRDSKSTFDVLVETIISHYVPELSETNVCCMSAGLSTLPTAVLDVCARNTINCTLLTTDRTEAEQLVGHFHVLTAPKQHKKKIKKHGKVKVKRNKPKQEESDAEMTSSDDADSGTDQDDPQDDQAEEGASAGEEPV